MILGYWSMVHKNIEGYMEYDINKRWYKNRKKGLSAVIRCYGDEKKIGPCIESCTELFDEIIVVLTEIKDDRTEDIVRSFNSSKIKLYKYPFRVKVALSQKELFKKMGRIKYNSKEIFTSPIIKRGTVHAFSYLTNWGLSKTTYSHIAPQWDADHILLPKYNNKKFKEFILSKNNIRVSGYNIATPDFKYLSKKMPYHSNHPRFFKVTKWFFYFGTIHNGEGTSYRVSFLDQLKDIRNYILYPFQQIQLIKNLLADKDYVFPHPIYLHTKLINLKEDLNTQGKYTGSKEYNKWRHSNCRDLGKKIDVEVPEFVFKKPEDYI